MNTGIPTNTGELWFANPAQLEGWQKAYTAISVENEMIKIAAWVMSNPRSAKTMSGMPRFVNTWLGKAHNQGGSPSKFGEKPSIPQPKAFDPDLGRHLWAAQEMIRARFSGMPVPDRVASGTYRMNLGRLIDAVDAGERLAKTFEDDGWLSESSRRSAVYGTVHAVISRHWA
jgi:hypothetical protein